MEWVYLNDQLVKTSEATISIDDRGFLFGLSVYESIPLFSAKPFCLDEHVSRLNNGLNQLELGFNVKTAWLSDVIQTLCAENKVTGDAKCYVQVTAGNCKERNYHPDYHAPTILVRLYAWEQHALPHHAITVEDNRYKYCQTKSNSLLAHAIAGRKAYQANAAEAIFILNGYVQECTTSNIFIVKNEQLFTPSSQEQLVAGVTRGWVIQYAKENGLAIESCSVSLEALYSADEVFITASYKGIHPIFTVDQKTIGNGRVGLITETIMAKYAQAQHPNNRH